MDDNELKSQISKVLYDTNDKAKVISKFIMDITKSNKGKNPGLPSKGYLKSLMMEYPFIFEEKHDRINLENRFLMLSKEILY